MSSRKGDRAERELSNWLEDEADWYAQRTGASGGATDRARPDVIAARPAPATLPKRARVAMVEVKAAADGTVHLNRSDIVELAEAASRAGGDGYVAVRPSLNSHDQWHVYALSELNETPSGNYSVRKEDLPGSTLVEVFAADA
jgi:Holliday junction resolvase